MWSCSADTPFSLRSLICPMPVCNVNDVLARSAFRQDMRLRMASKSVQHSMPRTPLITQRLLPATVLFKDHEKRKRERGKARCKDGRATDAKQARMRGRITAVCIKSASPSQTHGEQPGRNVVQANLPFVAIPTVRLGTDNKILRAPLDARVAPSTPKDLIPANMSTSLPETPFIHFVQPNALGLVVNWQT